MDRLEAHGMFDAREDRSALPADFTVEGADVWPAAATAAVELAAMATWALLASQRQLLGLAAAADKDQAKLLRDAIARLVKMNEWLAPIIKVDTYRVTNRLTGSELTILSSDVGSSYGPTPDFVLCDEVTHWQNAELWDSLFSSAAKRANCLIVVISNAGFGEGESWQWKLREAARQEAGWYFHRLDGPKASWITEDRLEEQRRLLPPIAFNRLWLNQWSSGSGDALDGRLIDDAITLDGPTTQIEDGWLYVAGVDLGISRDASAVVVVAKHVGWLEEKTKRKIRTSTQRAMIDAGVIEAEDETEETWHPGTGRLKVCEVRRWKPEGGRRVSVTEVEKTIQRLHSRYHLSEVAVYPWKAELLCERLDASGVPIRQVPFSGGNLRTMAMAVLEAFNEGLIDLYEHPHLIPDLRKLRVVERANGVRLQPPKSTAADGHGDCGTSLSLAMLSARTHSHTPNRVQHDLICYP
ncbi:MAG: hypothetical protein IID44_07200 [Planctomycetes bacterium]|nr:hypothetical protein [Planctomycetota bacterium]